MSSSGQNNTFTAVPQYVYCYCYPPVSTALPAPITPPRSAASRTRALTMRATKTLQPQNTSSPYHPRHHHHHQYHSSFKLSPTPSPPVANIPNMPIMLLAAVRGPESSSNPRHTVSVSTVPATTRVVSEKTFLIMPPNAGSSGGEFWQGRDRSSCHTRDRSRL